MKNRPLIAVTTSYDGAHSVRIREEYLNALSDAGAIPVPLARTTDPQKIAQYAEIFDGFFFSGGVDVDPAHYGEEITGAGVEIDAGRDAFELALFHAAYPTGKPILGICRGIQLINVALGGSLHQDIPGHSQSQPGEYHEQRVRIEPTSRLGSLSGRSELLVNSFHHQAVKQSAPALTVTAWAEDGTIEAAEATAHPFLLAVQWHPERYYRDDAAAAALFCAFVRACEQP